MPTVNLGRVRMKWRGAWAGSTAYAKDDIVRHGADTYVATTAHTSHATTFSNDSANWELMAQGADIPTQSGQTGNYLQTDGSTLSWAELDVTQNIAYAGTSVHNSWSTTAQNTWTTVGAGLNVAITPSATTSKILLLLKLEGGWDTHHYISSTRIQRSTNGGANWTNPTNGASDAGNGGTVGNTRAEYDANSMQHTVTMLLDSPNTTSECLYRVQIYGGQGGTWRLNTSASGGYNGNMWSGGTSHLTALEIKQ